MRSLTILSLLLVAITMGLSLAHVLELPGKLRLDETGYKSVQAIYYPGFTIGGLVGEGGGLLSLLLLLFLTPAGSNRFWWTVAAFLLLAAAHATYWLMAHPVNRLWVGGIVKWRPAAAFFATFAVDARGEWTELRNIWETSHIIRACLAMLSLIAIAVAASIPVSVG